MQLITTIVMKGIQAIAHVNCITLSCGTLHDHLARSETGSVWGSHVVQVYSADYVMVSPFLTIVPYYYYLPRMNDGGGCTPHELPEDQLHGGFKMEKKECGPQDMNSI